MRNKILLPALLIVSMLTTTVAKADLGFVITKTDTIICEDVTFELKDAHVKLINGNEMKIDQNDVQSFSIHGKTYDRLPVYVDNKPTGESSFLELVSQRDDLKLYKVALNEANKKGSGSFMYVVYKNGNFYLNVDKKNASIILEHFHVTNVKIS